MTCFFWKSATLYTDSLHTDPYMHSVLTHMHTVLTHMHTVLTHMHMDAGTHIDPHRQTGRNAHHSHPHTISFSKKST